MVGRLGLEVMKIIHEKLGFLIYRLLIPQQIPQIALTLTLVTVSHAHIAPDARHKDVHRLHHQMYESVRCDPVTRQGTQHVRFRFQCGVDVRA
jgi:hypothetical protein